MSRAKLVLFTPGPVRLPAVVADHLADPPVNYHRQEGFKTLFAGIERDLKALVGLRKPEAYQATMITSTGTGAVEACLLALAPQGKGLIIQNGFFGARWVDQCVQNGIAHEVLASSDTLPVDVAALDRALAADPSIKWVFFVAHETRAGLVNDMVAIGQTAKKHGCLVGCDVISAAYGYPIDIEAAELDLAVTSSAKAIQSVAGVGIVFVRLAILDRLAAQPRQGYYLDLVAETKKQRAGHETRFAQPVAQYAALAAACQHLAQMGIERHFARIRRQMQTLHDHLTGLGLVAQLEPAHRSWIAMNFKLPPGLEYPELARRLEAEGYYLLYGIPGDLTHFQVSTIGDLTDAHVTGIMKAFDKVLSPHLTGNRSRSTSVASLSAS
jgi:2-aminoethylphosphonate-pyruvate transaminase